MTTETKVLIGVLVATVIIIAGGAFFAGQSNDTGITSEPVNDVERLVRDDSPVLGSNEATVTIVEFGDFQCPACGAAHPILKQVKEQYADRPVRFVYRQFPLTHIHDFAQKAAEASLAAQAQGKFWEYHDLLFENQTELDRDSLIAYAESLELDLERFTEELDEGIYAEQVTQDVSDGNAVGVRGTPSFFINGVPLMARGLSDFEAAIEAELNPGT